MSLHSPLPPTHIACVATANSSVVQIQILEKLTATDEDASVEDIEQAALEAERMAQEAQRKAAELRERAQKARRLSHTSSD